MLFANKGTNLAEVASVVGGGGVGGGEISLQACEARTHTRTHTPQRTHARWYTRTRNNHAKSAKFANPIVVASRDATVRLEPGATPPAAILNNPTSPGSKEESGDIKSDISRYLTDATKSGSIQDVAALGVADVGEGREHAIEERVGLAGGSLRDVEHAKGAPSRCQ